MQRRRTILEKQFGILNSKQNDLIKVLVESDLTKEKACKAVHITQKTFARWKKDKAFMKAYAEASKRYQKTVDVSQIVKEATSGKIPRDTRPLSEYEIFAARRGLKDFEYFREHYLGRKSWKCQKKWIKFVLENEHSSIECPGRHGKSLTMAVDLDTWFIVKDRNVLIGLYSKSSGLVEKWVAGIKRNLKKKALTRAYGEFKPEARDERWNRTEFEVIRPNVSDEDAVHPTVSAAGITSDIFGTKFNILILDDICGKDNVRTEEQRQNVIDIVTEALIPATQNGEATERKVINIGTPMYPYDFLYWCKHNGDFVCMKDVVVNWDTKAVLAPESRDYNTYPKIVKLRRRLGERAFNKRFMCHAVLDSDILFDENWFTSGINYAKKYSYGEVPPEHLTLISVDPATSQRRAASNLGIACVSFVPGTDKRHLSDYFDNKLRIDFQAGKILDFYQNLSAELIIVEKNACQAYLKALIDEEAKRRGISVRIELSFTGTDKTTTWDKLEDLVGVERLSPLFEHGNYKLPYYDEGDKYKTARLTDKLKVATLQEVPDILMAMWFAEKYIATLAKKVIRLRKRPDLPPCLRSA